MGPKQSTTSSNKDKKVISSEDEDKYYEFVRNKTKKDESKHEFISNQKGTAFHKLQNTDR